MAFRKVWRLSYIRPAGKVGLTIFYKGKPLAHRVYREPPRQAELFSSKQLNPELDARIAAKKKRGVYVPPEDHPWRRFRINNNPSQP